MLHKFFPSIRCVVPACLLAILLTTSAATAQPVYFPPLVGTTWDTVSATSLGWCQDKLDSLLDFVGQRNSKAFILLKDGKIVAERYYGTFTVDSSWYWASAGKSLTSFLVGMAQQEGFLSITDTTSDYLGTGWTSCTSQQEARITIRNQLTMTSGLDDGVVDKDCTDDTCLHYLADPGTRWAYHNAPYTLLDPVLENATGRTINQYFSQKLSVNTGMTGLYVKVGYNNVFFSKARSFARYGLLILNHGEWNGNRIMTDTTYFNDMVNTSQPLNNSYGYLWWLNGKPSFMAPGYQFVFPGSWSPAAPSDMFAAMGKNGQLLNIVPSMNLVWVRMGEEPSGNFVPFALNDTIWQYLDAAMCGVSSAGEAASSASVELYPNPVRDLLEITTSFTDGFSLEALGVTGSIFRTIPVLTAATKLDTSSWPAGIYYLRFTGKRGVVVKRVIVG